MPSEDKDDAIFMGAVEGRYKANSEVLQHSEVPRPDCELWLLKFLSTFPLTGLFGIDHFFLRSQYTGIAKLFTLGGFGLWYLWDALQVWTETKRILNYGMSTPFDFYTGIGQGMITDLPTNYTSTSSYTKWMAGIAFGFIGLDSMMALNIPQTIRKVLEFVLFIVCLVTVCKGVSNGIVGFIFALIFLIYFGSMIAIEYSATLISALDAGLMKNGIIFSEKVDEASNSFLKWMVDNLPSVWFDPETKGKIMRDLQYGGITAADLAKMFKIRHKVAEKEEDLEGSEGAHMSSIFIYLFSPIILLFGGLVNGLIWFINLIFPWTKTPPPSNRPGNPFATMKGGAKESLSIEAQIMGATVVALVAGGSLKGLVDYLIKE